MKHVLLAFLPLDGMKCRGTLQMPQMEYASPPHTRHAFGCLREVSTDLRCLSSLDRSPQSREFSPRPDLALTNSLATLALSRSAALGRPLVLFLPPLKLVKSSSLLRFFLLCLLHTLIASSPKYLRFLGSYSNI